MRNRPDISLYLIWQSAKLLRYYPAPTQVNGKDYMSFSPIIKHPQTKYKYIQFPITFKAGKLGGLFVEQAKLEESKIIARERQRIAREIHDGIAQDLAALSLKTHLCKQLLENNPADLLAELDEIKKVLDTTLVELRRTIYGLRPVSLEEHGLMAALHILAAEFSAQYPLYVCLDISDDEGNLPHTLEHPIFRMAQEALHNIVQHAQATHARMSLSLTPDKLIFSIEDDGCGFTTKALWTKVRSGHVGLQQMRERVANYQGTISIQSDIGQGTCISATFPCR